jgi:glyoxylate carboligase
MQREFRHLVMTNIRRIAHSPGEGECIARLLHMQVILVCVANAALKMWISGRKARRDPGGNVMPQGIPEADASEMLACEEDPADTPVIPLRTLWECIADIGESLCSQLVGPDGPAVTGTAADSTRALLFTH